MNIYLISGLGADHRAFQYLDLDKRHTLIHIPWLNPGKNESLEQYAIRIAAAIDTQKSFAIIGVSFGGMIATEIAKITTPYKTILISSVSRRKDLPALYRIAGKLRLHKLIPSRAGNRANPLMYWLFGSKGKDQKELLSQILTDSNTAFTRWAIDAMLNWKNFTVVDSIITIHGDRDRILPIREASTHHRIKGGGHLMVVNKPGEVSSIINNLLQE